MKRNECNITQQLLGIFFLSLFLCGCYREKGDGSGIILIDGNKKYPELNLRLSDIADVSYVPLKTDGVLFGYSQASRALFVHGNKIFIGDRFRDDPKLVMYDFNGTFLQLFGSYGRGPGEYMDLKGFAVDTLTSEVIIYDNFQKKLIVYGMEGKFRREKSLKEMCPDQQTFQDFEIINNDCFVFYNERSLTVADMDFSAEGLEFAKKGQFFPTGKTLLIIDKQTLSEVPFPEFEYAKAGVWLEYCLYYHLTTLRDGIYMTTERADTIYYMNRDLEITPKFRDITDYGNLDKARLFPSLETERYVFFYTEIAIPQIGPRRGLNETPVRFFVFDKMQQQIYRLSNGISDTYHSRYDRPKAMINNRIALDQYTLTLNHNYAARFLSPEFLFEHLNDLPDELKEITKNLKIDDNPVVMLMKFK